nr:PREDICTED: U2 small nuclear ribonucleoprotein A' [Bemisia tabaci]
MVKLSPELISQCMQYTNPVHDRELDLRGYKIPIIENLGATFDQFDTLDLSDNDIRKLDGFCFLKRLKCLLLNNNRIVRIANGLEEFIPNLESLILTGNLIDELCDLDPLSTLPKLTTLSLLYCPVTTKQHYRLYVVYKIPQLTLLDFKKIRLKEREEAAALFNSDYGKEMRRTLEKRSKAKTFVPGAPLSRPANGTSNGPSSEQIQKIREAISKASSLEEVERLNRLLQAGQIPSNSKKPEGNQNIGNNEEEEEEEDEEEENEDVEMKEDLTNGHY